MATATSDRYQATEDLVRFHYPLPSNEEGPFDDVEEESSTAACTPRRLSTATSFSFAAFSEETPSTPTNSSAATTPQRRRVPSLPLTPSASERSLSTVTFTSTMGLSASTGTTTPQPKPRATAHRVYDIVVLYGHLPFLHWYTENLCPTMDIKTGTTHTPGPHCCWQEDRSYNPQFLDSFDSTPSPRRPPSPEPSRRRGAPPPPDCAEYYADDCSLSDSSLSYSRSPAHIPFGFADVTFHSIYDPIMPRLISTWLQPLDAMPPVRTHRQSGPVGVFFGQVLGGGSRRWRAMEWAFDTKCMIAYLCSCANVVVYDLQLVSTSGHSPASNGRRGKSKSSTVRYHAVGQVACAEDLARLEQFSACHLLGDHLGFWEATTPIGQDCFLWLNEQHDNKTKPQFRSEAVEYQAPPPCVAPLRVGKHSQQPRRR